jgi:hypothetical protein
MKREPTAQEREKIGSAIGACKAGRVGEGGVGKCSRHRRVTTLRFTLFIPYISPCPERSPEVLTFRPQKA